MGHFFAKGVLVFCFNGNIEKGEGGCTLLIFKWQGCDVHLWFQKDKNCPWIYEWEDGA